LNLHHKIDELEDGSIVLGHAFTSGALGKAKASADTIAVADPGYHCRWYLDVAAVYPSHIPSNWVSCFIRLFPMA